MNRTPLALLLALPLLTTACRDEGTPAGPQGPTEEAGLTPAEMYAKSQELLMPSAEREGPDTGNAMKWLIRAAEGGHRQAQSDLGGIYFHGGKGVAPDPAKALQWFNRAGGQGDMQALVFAGDIYFYGYGGETDRPKALALWRQAADAGVAEAEYCLGNAMVRYYKDDVAEGVEHLKKAAAGVQGGLAAKSALMLAGIYMKGYEGVTQDTAAAVEWYRIAAEAGSPEGQLVYGLMLLEGAYAAKDEKKGLAFLRLAAGQDNLQAISALIQYLEAAGGQEEAAAWRKRAAELQK